MMLKGKTALVTGGRGGIGRAICARFLREGARVFAADLSTGGSLQDGDTAEDFLQIDVTSEASVIAAFEHVAAEAGCLDILVNAAGIEIEKTIEETSLDEWNNIFAVNVTGTFLVSKHALPLLRRSNAAGGASVINFGSYDGFIADRARRLLCDQGRGSCADKGHGMRPRPEGIQFRHLPGICRHADAAVLFEGEGRAATAAPSTACSRRS